MKTLLLLTAICIMLINTLFAQSIKIYSPTTIYRTIESSAYNLKFAVIGGDTSTKYKISVTDAENGSAIKITDYTLAPYTQTTPEETQMQTCTISLHSTDTCNIIDKTIMLYVKAVPQVFGQATLNDTVTLTIHRTDALISRDKKTCREKARAENKSWPNDFNGTDINYDSTNTPKTEFLAYTDLKGFDPDQPNGLAQTEFIFKWPVVKKWIVNRPGFKLQLLRSVLLPDFFFSRIDKINDVLLYKPAHDTLNRPSTGIKDSIVIKSKNINSFDLIKYSNLHLNTIISLVNLQFSNSRLMLDVQGTLYRMRVDSNKLSENFDPVYAISFAPMLFFETGNGGLPDKFQLRSTLSMQNLKMLSNTFSQVDGASTIDSLLTAYNSKDKINYVNHSSPIWQFTVRLSRSISKDDKTSFYFRYSISEQRVKNILVDELHKNIYNFFSQYQVGVNLNIDAFAKQ